MNTAIFDTHQFERKLLENVNVDRHQLDFIEARLTESTAALAAGCGAVSCFANDRLDAVVLAQFHQLGVS